MQMCDHFKRRIIDRPGSWMIAIIFLCLVTIIVLVENYLTESSRQERFHTYLNQVIRVTQ